MFGLVRVLDEKYCSNDSFTAFCKITDSIFFNPVGFENCEFFLSATYTARVFSSCPDYSHDQGCKTTGHLAFL
jgi:hypothetical protein